MCIVQHVEMKSVFTFQSIKRLLYTTVKSAKPAFRFWKFLFWGSKTDNYGLAVMVHIFLLQRRVATTKNRSHFHFWRNFSANHNQAHPNLNQKCRSYSIYGKVVSTPHWLIQLTKTSFLLSFHTLSVYIKATWFSQSPTTVLSGLSTLDQIQWPWL